MSWFVCPLDGLPLTEEANSLRCANGHTFDRAREGYVNLLPVQFKASKDPGDNKDMVQARKRFLEAGYYLPIASKLSEVVKGLAPTEAIVDAGCGEGYYLDFLARAGCHRLAGIDISKWAVQAAAKRNREIQWAVASNRELPFASESVGLILCLFGFPVWEGFRKTQKPGGRVLLVDPAPGHLRELRAVIYPEVRETKLAALPGAEAHGYRPEVEERLSFSVSLPNRAGIQDLLAMTPHGYRMPPAGRAAVQKLTELTVTVDVMFRQLRLN